LSKWDAVVKALDKAGVNDKIEEEERIFLSTGVPNLDYILSGKYRGGGLQSGRMVEIFGPPSAGKTQIATMLMREAQRADGAARFEDAEKAFAFPLASGFGLDLTPGPFSYSKSESFEASLYNTIDWMQTIRGAKIIEPTSPMAVIFDSLASMVPMAKIEAMSKGAAGLNMKDKLALATATSQELPGFVSFVEKHNVLAVFLNQMREKPGVMYGDPTTTPGGKAPEYYASTRIKLSRQILVDTAKNKVGQKITAETTKNKVFRPWLKTSWFFRFRPDGTGYIDVLESMFEHLVERGAIKKADKMHYEWEGGKSKKGNILNKLRQDEAKSLEMLLDMTDGLGALDATPPAEEGEEEA